MKTKQLITYTFIALIIGLGFGWLIFGNSPKDSSTHKNSLESKKEEIWTCSMHPQIRQPEPGDCPICGMDLIPLEANSNSNPLVFEMTEEAIKIANIQTTIVGLGNSNSKEIKLSGKIKADETNSASIVSHISGRIEKLFISYTGERVNKGQKIASIYSPKLITAQKELLEAYKVKDINPKLYEATASKLKFWKLSEEQIQAIISSEKIIESFNIYASYSGVVLNKKVSVGDYLKEGEILFDIQNLNQLWAVFDVYETELSNIKKGTEISFSTPAIPGKTFTSTINFVDPIINPTTRTASIRTSITNQSNLLKPEMFLEGKINANNNSSESLLVPKSSVLWTGEKSVVYVKLPESKIPSFEFREVLIGESVGENYLVKKGISNGEQVVTNGAFVIDASAQLNNQSSMMNRNLVSNNIILNDLPDYTNSTSSQFKTQLNKMTDAYILLKDVLIEGNTTKASEKASSLINTLTKVDMKLLKGEAHIYWMEKLNEIKISSNQIVKSKEIKEQREVFSKLSESIISTLKTFGVEKNTFYVQYCPMAENDKGAYWLSKESTIKNPYFGEEMLTCGTVKEKIDNNYRNNHSPMSGHNH